MASIKVPQGTIEYQASGPQDSSEPPVVFLHPVLTNGALWTPVAERLAERGIRSYAPTLPLGSHTLALNADADRSPAGVAGLVRDFLAALELNDVTLVGNDTGGALVQFILAEREPRVSRAVLLNCDAFATFPPFPFNAILSLLKSNVLARALAGQMRLRALRHSWLGFGLLAKNLPAALTRAWIEPMRTNAGVRADLVQFLRNVRPADLAAITPQMATVTVPVTIVWGMDDHAFRPSLGRRLHAAFGNAEWAEAPGARTLLALDAPDAVVDAITKVQLRR